MGYRRNTKRLEESELDNIPLNGEGPVMFVVTPPRNNKYLHPPIRDRHAHELIIFA